MFVSRLLSPTGSLSVVLLVCLSMALSTPTVGAITIRVHARVLPSLNNLTLACEDDMGNVLTGAMFERALGSDSQTFELFEHANSSNEAVFLITSQTEGRYRCRMGGDISNTLLLVGELATPKHTHTHTHTHTRTHLVCAHSCSSNYAAWHMHKHAWSTTHDR